MITFTRTDRFDGATEFLTLVQLPESFYCEHLDRETPYAVQVVQGEGDGAEMIGLYDLDGEKLTGVHVFEAVHDAPADVIDAVQTCWETAGAKVAVVFEVGQRVQGGAAGSDDHDAGVVSDVDGEQVTVAWDSGVRTTQRAEVLRPAD